MRFVLGILFAAAAFGQTGGALQPVPIQQPLDNAGRTAAREPVPLHLRCGHHNPAGDVQQLRALGAEHQPHRAQRIRSRSQLSISQAVSYKIVLAYAVLGSCPVSPGTVIWSQDNVYDFGELLKVTLAGGGGGSQIGFQQPGGSLITIGGALTSAGFYDIGYDSLTTACSNAGTAPLIITKSWTALSTQTISCAIQFAGGILQPSAAQTVTFTGHYDCPVGQQCFDTSLGGAGSIVFSGAAAQQTLDIRAMGAKCNGVVTGIEPAFTGTDDTLAIQSSYNAFPTVSSRVQITGPPSQICLATTVRWKAPVMFAGQGGTIAKYCGVSCSGATTTALIYAAIGDTTQGQTLRNVTLIGDPAVASGGIDFENGPQTNDSLDTVTINRFGGTGVKLNAANDYTLKDVSATDNGIRNLDIEASTDVNFTGTNVFQALTIQPTDNILINGSNNIYGGGFQCEIVYALPCMKFVNSIVDFTGLTGYWASASGTLNVPAAFVIANTGAGRTRLRGINTWVQNGTVLLPMLVSDTEAVAFVGTQNFIGNGNSTATTGFNVLLWGDYSVDGSNAGVGPPFTAPPFSLPVNSMNIIGGKMATVSTATGVAGGTNFSLMGDVGGRQRQRRWNGGCWR